MNTWIRFMGKLNSLACVHVRTGLGKDWRDNMLFAKN
jgi:hypothetical protein